MHDLCTILIVHAFCSSLCYFHTQIPYQSDCRIFKSIMCLKQSDKITWCWYKFIEKSCLKKIEVSVVKNWCDYSGHRTLKLAVCQERINGINWVFACWYKFKKAKSYCNSYWMVVVKNWHGLLKALSQVWDNFW